MNKNQAGFTLIELVAVIVIMGILAAEAIPKFVDLGSDARKSKLNAAAGALASMSSMAHAKFIVTVPSPTSLVFEGVTVTYANGYPNAASMAAASGLSTNDYTINSTATALTVSPVGATTPASCQVVFTQAANVNTPPTIVITQTNCS